MKSIKLFLKKHKHGIFTGIILIAVFILGLYLRNLSMPDKMIFGYEQGRDAIVARDMLSQKKLTLLGPKTDIEGVFHGAGYYYYLSTVYLLTDGDPAKAIFVFTFFNALTIIIIFFLAKEIIGSTRYAIASAIMAAISFDTIIYGRWLSNVSLSIPLVALFFYFLTKLIKTRNTSYWIPVGLLSGALSHFEVLHVMYAVFSILISIKLFSLPIKNRKFIIGGLLFLLINSTFLVFDFRHNFLLSSAVINYLSAQALSVNPINVIYQYINGLTLNMVLSVFPSNGILIFLFFLILTYLYRGKIKNDKSYQIILLIILFSFPYIFLLKYSSLEHFYAGTSIGWILLFNFLISRHFDKAQKYVLVLLYLFIVFSHFNYSHRNLLAESNVFYHSVQKSYIYKDQLATYDYIFTHAPDGFTIESFNIPYYHQEAWQYLYDWYGNKKYPEAHANNSNANPNKKLFIVIEPGTEGKILNEWLRIKTQDTVLLNKIYIGSIEVQERKKIFKSEVETSLQGIIK